MNKTKLTPDAVLETATELITANGSTTTLEVKRVLRTKDYEAFQEQVSKMMLDLYGEGKLAATDGPGHQIYDLPQAAAGGAQAATAPSTNATLIQKLISRCKNPAVAEILLALTSNKQITRKGQIGVATGDQVDSALKLLLDKRLIIRVAKGVYEAFTSAPHTPVASTSVAPLSEVDQLKADLAKMKDDNAKMHKFVQVVEDAQATIDSAVGSIRAALDELKN